MLLMCVHRLGLTLHQVNIGYFTGVYTGKRKLITA